MPKYTALSQFTALYERLSKDDEQQGESNSISNQKEYLENYAKRNGFSNIKHYTDDGYTGKNFNRPGVQKLIKDVEDGLIGTIIVKDMSRFGRNYLQVGLYTEMMFPQNNVRFIAVNNNVDSDKPQENDFTPFLNIMNEWYVKDTSNKITAIFLSKMKDGKRCSGSIPYGYNRLPGDKQTLVVDPVASKVVQKIFELAATKKGPTEIARILSEEKILIPSAYTLKYHPEQSNRRASVDNYKWNSSTVAGILHRQEYIGNTVLRKSICTNFKTDTRRAATEDEQFVFENTHEPIISKELWDNVQKFFKRNKRVVQPGVYSKAGILNGLIFCADCGSKMSREMHHSKADGTEYFTYRCGFYAGKDSKCTVHFITENQLFTILLHSIQRLSKRIITDEKGFAKELQAQWQAKENSKPQKAKTELNTLQKRFDELDGLIQSLYENFAGHLIPERQYKMLMQKYVDEQNELTTKIDEVNDTITECQAKAPKVEKFIEAIREYKYPTELTKEMAHALIDKVCIHQSVGRGNKRTCEIEIYYNFIGQFELAYTEEEIMEIAETEAQKELAKKERQRENSRKHSAKVKAERYAANEGHKFPKKVCGHCGKEFWPNSSIQVYCSKECSNEVNKERINAKRLAEKGNHTFRQKNCTVCGKPFWPSNGQEVMCSKECKAKHRREKQLAYYHETLSDKEKQKRIERKEAAMAENDGHLYPQKNCEQCGKPFYPIRPSQKYCCLDCGDAHFEAVRLNRDPAEKEGHKYFKQNCIMCGKEYWPNGANDICCSDECRKERIKTRNKQYRVNKKAV